METIKILIKEKLESQRKKGKWILNQWVKKVVLLSFQVTNQKLISNGPGKSFCGQSPI